MQTQYSARSAVLNERAEDREFNSRGRKSTQ